MARPRKVKVLRSVRDVQLQFPSSISGISTITSGIGIGSTTLESDTSFILIGKRNLSDCTVGFVAVSGNASCSGCPGSGGGHPGAGCAGGGANFIAANVSNFGDSIWCVQNVGCACTAAIFCRYSDTNTFMMANRGNNGHTGCPGSHQPHGESSHNSSGSPGVAGIASNMCGVYATTNMFFNVCCVQGTGGSGCPLSPGLGGFSGYQNSIYCTNCIVTSGFSTASQGNNRTYNRGGWVHVNATGRKENLIPINC